MSSTEALRYWVDPTTRAEHILFNPWSDRAGAFTVHEHGHTERIQYIHQNYIRWNLQTPAEFNWGGKTIYLVGRGASLNFTKDILSSDERKSPAIFLNQAPNITTPKPGDFVMALDHRAEISNAPEGVSLIASPAVPPSIVELPWARSYGFAYFNHAPMNDWIESLFPGLPQLVECISVFVSALHLCALNGAKNVVCVGCDFCTYDDAGEYHDIVSLDGSKVSTTADYAQTAAAAAYMALLMKDNAGTQVINTANCGIFGLNLQGTRAGSRFPWIEQMTLEEAIKNYDA